MNEETYRERLNDLQLEVEELRAKLKEAQTGDTISRQAALDAVFNNAEHPDKAYEAIRHLPSAQPEPQWIPCSERLPEPNEEDADGFIKAYLVQDGRWMDVARWNGDRWIAWGYGTALTNVTAWMPLPEPYAERGTDDC